MGGETPHTSGVRGSEMEHGENPWLRFRNDTSTARWWWCGVESPATGAR